MKMLKTYVNFGTFLLLCFINAFVHSESNRSLLQSFNKNPVKRHDDFQTCLDNFDIHQDKIIRTQDSREMGAKYINERDVLSRDECLRLCCETDTCDVFVFEEKTPGSCYLFECGTPEDFKCKFTKHKNYTSAVLAINRHLTELESQIKFTQHEHELTNLRQPAENGELSRPREAPLTTSSPLNLETLNTAVERPPSQQSTEKQGKCSQYQFKCHTSGECIAVYNACDGIPQCADGSDEAPELKCPTAAPPFLTTTRSPKVPIEKIGHKTSEEQKKDLTKSPSANPQPLSSVSGGGGEEMPPPGGSGYAMSAAASAGLLPPSSQQLSGAPIANPYYGREGEGMANRHTDQWPTHLYHQNQGTSQIFNHKGSGIIPQNKNDWYYPHPYNPPDSLPQNLGELDHCSSCGSKTQQLTAIPHVYHWLMGEYLMLSPSGEYKKMTEPWPMTWRIQQMMSQYDQSPNYYDNVGGYRQPPQGQAINAWQGPHKTHDSGLGGLPGEEMSRLERLPVLSPGGQQVPGGAPPAGLPSVEDYYEELYRNQLQQQQSPYLPLQSRLVPPPPPPHLIPHHQSIEHQMGESPMDMSNEDTGAKHDVPKKKPPTQPPEVTTLKPKDVTQAHVSHRKADKVSAESKVKETPLEEEIDGHNASPSGAVLSLTMGLVMTGIMLIFVSCRMKVVRRRMRRGGKSPYAHDADFLVNGMYL